MFCFSFILTGIEEESRSCEIIVMSYLRIFFRLVPSWFFFCMYTKKNPINKNVPREISDDRLTTLAFLFSNILQTKKKKVEESISQKEKK